MESKKLSYSEIGTVLAKELSRSEVEQLVGAFKKKFGEHLNEFMQTSDIESGLRMQFDGDGCYRKCWDELKSSILVLSHYEFVR